MEKLLEQIQLVLDSEIICRTPEEKVEFIKDLINNATK